ncbi:hypothetical protein MUK42_22956 [Musa troglodytarum]|uniref:Uncharacterized protein n=1 Tax=Musa troglodytarum TaxID=320322 RepID=A0A9E7GKG6_9LILI|nr:hypothetical protein MUK42_22956 [Musa troglodytarum]
MDAKLAHPVDNEQPSPPPSPPAPRLRVQDRPAARYNWLHDLPRFERLAPDGPPEEKARLKEAVWLLSTALVVAFSWRVSELMPWALAVLIWISAGCVAVGGFYGLFLYKEQIDENGR